MIRGLQTMKISKPQHLRIEENNAKLKITLSLDSKMVMYGDHYQSAEITDTIILGCQVKYILQGGDVKECSSFDRLNLSTFRILRLPPIQSFHFNSFNQ